MIAKLSKFLRINRRSVLITWLLSYAAILLLPLALGFLVYRESSDTLKGEIHKANDWLLSQVRENMDNQLQLMQQLNFELTWNVQVQELLYSNKYDQSPNEYVYDLFQSAKSLKQYNWAYPSVDLFYIYLNDIGSVLLPGTSRDQASAYQTLHSHPVFPYSQWHAAVSKTDSGSFMPMMRLTDEGGSARTLAYVCRYPMDNGKFIASNVIMADQSRLMGAVSAMEIFDDGYVLVLDGNNQVLVASSDIELAPEFPYDQLKEGSSNIFYTLIGGQKYEVSSIASSHAGLTYVSLIPSRLFWEKAEHIRTLTTLGALVNLTGGGLLTYYFLRRNYHPVRRLVQMLSRQSKLPQREEVYNEFQYLQHAIDRTLAEMDNAKTLMSQQQHILRSHFILRLLKGKLDNQVPVDESLTKFDMNFESDDFAVLLLYVEERSQFFESVPYLDSGDQWRWLQFIITNVVEELASERNRGYVAEADEALACLISFRPGEADSRKEELLRVARVAQQFLAEKYRIHLTVAISGICNGISGISRAYAESLDAMEYKLVVGSKEIITYEDVAAESSDKGRIGYYYPQQVKQRLMNYVKAGEFENAMQTLDEIIERNVGRHLLSVPLAKCLMFNLVSTLIETIDEIGVVEESFLIHNPKQLERLTSSETIQEMQTQLKGLLLQVCEYTAAKRQQDMQLARMREIGELAGQIKAFIEENYRDPDLNISLIGAHFQKKATYLSKLFKDHTGGGLLDYINTVRVEKAKALLADDKMTIYEAAGTVGYRDVNAFIRIFKKVEGITPGKYKETQG
ncbi:MAG: hypothetical protein K0R57_354 [Paenibacillaceae bacterium]|nr:hypothetical protein [Paenibacillaceae bacterium]